MRILLVEDGKHKTARIKEAIAACGAEFSKSTETAVDLVTARDRLKKNRYDLLILDIAVPNRAGETPLEHGGIELLREIMERAAYKRPNFIIGLTQHTSLFEAAASNFDEFSWSVLQYSDERVDWAESLQRYVRHVVLVNSTPQDSGGVDVAILCALASPELRAVRELNCSWVSLERTIDSFEYFRGSMPAVNGGSISIIACAAERMGLVGAAIQASNVIQNFKPKLVVMAGICAGIAGASKIGDVIVSDVSWNYQSGKIKNGKFEPDPQYVPIEPPLRRRLKSYKAKLEEQLSGIHNAWLGEKPKSIPDVHVGPLASGSCVVQDLAVSEMILSQNRKALGLDMETYAIYAACWEAPMPAPLFVSIKAVCDMADIDKNNTFQNYTAHISAKAVEELLQKGVLSLN